MKLNLVKRWKKITGLLTVLAAANVFGVTAQKPNVILIYSDDVGYGDLGVYGAKMIPTPHLDKLAAGGLVFTDGHSPASTCSASRFAMLTGHLAHRRGIRVLPPNAPLPILAEDYTLPKVFKAAGYKTAVIGKWHLGLGAKGVPTNWNGEVKPGPLEIGFDYSFLLPSTNDRVPCVYLENHRVVNLDPNDPISIGQKDDPRSTEYPDGKKNPEAMTYYKSTHGHNDSVINGIGRIGTMYGGKAALWNDETMSDEFVKRSEKFIDQHLQANKDQPFFLFFCSQCIHVPRTPHPRFKGKSQLGYRGDAMVELDWSTGAIMEMLEKRGIADNTMVIFTSDNGPVYDDGYDDGTTVPTSTREVDRGHDASGPYRGGKYQIYEGGTRVPFIVSWPAKIKPGKSAALITHTDFMLTFADLLGVKLPEGAAPDSQNSLKALLGEDPKGNPYMVEEAVGYALRHGDWKLVMESVRQKAGEEKGALKFKLYNLGNDIGEQHDVAANHPERVAQLSKILIRIKDGAGVRESVASGG
ncbi:MAG: arylsulfatase [Kiritimatiellae bacterium]|nr:arylsulfatase [Kiritimatiellia bacterium]